MTELLNWFFVQSIVNCVERQLQPVGDTKFVKNIVQMVLDRLLADEHLVSDLFILIALRNEYHDLTLAIA